MAYRILYLLPPPNNHWRVFATYQTATLEEVTEQLNAYKSLYEDNFTGPVLWEIQWFE